MKILPLLFCSLLYATQSLAAEHELTPVDEGNSVDYNHDGVFDYDYIYPPHNIRHSDTQTPDVIIRLAKEYQFPAEVAGNGEIVAASLRFGFSKAQVLDGAPQYHIYTYSANGSFERNGDLTPVGQPIMSEYVSNLVTGQNSLDITSVVQNAHANNEKIGLLFMVDNGAEVLQYDAAYWSTIVLEHSPGTGGNGNNPPVVTINSPLGNLKPHYGTPISFLAESTDPEDGDLTDLIHWYSDISGILGVGGSLSGVILPQGLNTVTAKVVDSVGETTVDTVQITVTEPFNEPPEVQILAPSAGSSVSIEQAITFEGSAMDDINGDLTTQIQWSSDLDGLLGFGATLTRSISAGQHTITASVSDSFDELGADELILVVVGENTSSDYCESRGQNTRYEYLDSIEIENNRYQSGNDGGYRFSDHEFALRHGANNIELAAGFSGAQYDEAFSVYIDLNNNGNYDLPERLFLSNGKTVSGVITVPNDIANGDYNMRVLMQYGGAAGPCFRYNYGETEDFLISIE